MKHDYMSHELTVPELTLRGMILGIIITIIFTASNVYLGLKVGLTFSSSIPAAVISMAVLRLFKDSNVLENNMVQTQASAAGTLSAVIFVLPGLLMVGYWAGFPYIETMLLCACGGALGVLFTIPLRRVMVVNSDLTYPEGRAAAEILKVGSHEPGQKKKSAGGMKEIVTGGAFAGLISLCSNGFHVLSDSMVSWISVGKAVTQLPLGFSSALLGAGYLIGIASGIAMLVGTLITWGGFVPYFTSVLPMEGSSISDFAMGVWSQKVRFIGAGTIAIAAVWTLIRLFRPILEGIRTSLNSMKMTSDQKATHRMDTDLSMKTVGIVFALIIVGLAICFYEFVDTAAIPGSLMATLVVVGILVALFVGFFVAAACGYMAGLIGTSASPISGIGIIAIIISSVVIYFIAKASHLLDTDAGVSFAIAISLFMTSAVVCIAAISNDNLQDLKTGQLVGATPWKQQAALLIGSVAGAVAIAPVLNLLYQAYGFAGAMPRADMDPSAALVAPQATLMSTIANGIFNSTMDWTYFFMGCVVGVIFIVINLLLTHFTKFSLPPLAVGMGIYLPPTLEIPLVIGAVISWIVHKKLWNRATDRNEEFAEEEVEQCNRRGVLFSSGLIVGESIVGVIIAGIIVLSVAGGGSQDPLALVGKDFASKADYLGLLCFVITMVYLIRLVWTTKFNKEQAIEERQEAEREEK